jgi:hypothetical protein
MMKTFSSHNSRYLSVCLMVLWFFAAGVINIHGQSAVPSNSAENHNLPHGTSDGRNTSDTAASIKKPLTTEEKLDALTQMLEQQNARLNQLQQTVTEQQEIIRLLAGKTSSQPAAVAMSAGAPTAIEGSPTPQTPSVEDRLKKVETRVSEIGAIKFSGDIRLRAESIYGQENFTANANNPAILGNELSSRNRMRLRARLQMRGSVNDEIDWGLRFATGSFADNISTNQTLTDFFNRKPFGLDQAFLTYKPKRVPGLRLQGGKFETPWMFTEMTIDNDLMVDGFNESYTRTFKKSTLKDLTFVAWQLPMLERNSAFVRNANGSVNIEQSHRGGRDLALYGGEVRARFEPSSRLALNLSASDLYYSGTQFISPVQVFGSQLLLPLTFTIPASGATPAQTITTQVAISRDLLVAGNANLGLTNASNNAINRDGRLASGYNLVDLLGRVELKHSKRWPVTLIGNFVINTQVHDVVTAGPGGADLLLPNNENKGFWGEVQVGAAKARGDIQLGYTFMQIEKDAVLTPFNFSDITQQSDMRGHRVVFGYTADPRVTFNVIGIVTQRLNGLFGPFVPTPAGSLDRSTFRLQLETIVRF